MVVLTDEIIRIDENAVRKLFVEYGMKPEEVRRDVAIIKQWMLKQTHLPRIPPSKDEETDYWIENLLRLTKNSVDKVKIAIDSYYKGKRNFCDLFSIPDFGRYVHSDLFNNVYMMLLPNLTPDGVKIMLYGVTSHDSSLFQPKDFFRRMAMILDLQLRSGVDFTGLYVIIYAKYGTLGHLTQFDLLYLKKVFKIARRAYPIRLKHTHIVYPPFFIETAIKIMRPFLSKKVMSRVSVHKDLDTLRQVIPKENLPSDLGGSLPSLAELHDDWRRELVKNFDWLKERLSMQSDESKRPRKEKNVFKYGKNGTFKDLSVD